MPRPGVLTRFLPLGAAVFCLTFGLTGFLRGSTFVGSGLISKSLGLSDSIY